MGVFKILLLVSFIVYIIRRYLEMVQPHKHWKLVIYQNYFVPTFASNPYHFINRVLRVTSIKKQHSKSRGILVAIFQKSLFECF